MLTRWNPFAELNKLQDAMACAWPLEAISRAWPTAEVTGEFSPSVDIYEDEKNIRVKADIPGVNPEDMKIRFENGVLTLKGERKLEKEEKRDNFYRVERVYGSFSRSFTLPEAVESEGIEAKYNEGVLTITLPKRPESNNRKEIKVTH
jgi:HSP20 family protein